MRTRVRIYAHRAIYFYQQNLKNNHAQIQGVHKETNLRESRRFVLPVEIKHDR